MSKLGEYKRAQCVTCLRPQSACICQWVAPIISSVQLLILQHPMEVSQAKGSARLLHLSILNSQLFVGEIFKPDHLHSLLYADDKLPVLLYPDMSDMQFLDSNSCPLSDSWQGENSSRIRLVIIDATWRKSRKMFYLNPLLQSLPRLCLQPLSASRYYIRKAQKTHQLSSLEAACYALAQVEQNQERYSVLLEAFDGFVAQQMAYNIKEKIEES